MDSRTFGRDLMDETSLETSSGFSKQVSRVSRKFPAVTAGLQAPSAPESRGIVLASFLKSDTLKPIPLATPARRQECRSLVMF